jgi:GT2 family glycosyltransferase
MAHDEPIIEIVIPNWNGEKFLKDCLSSLARQSFQGFTVTVVDNGSTDGSIALLQCDFPNVKIIRFPENRGFSEAVNAGIGEASAPWILLLNNDMEVDAHCLAALRDGIEKYCDYDFFALKMRSFHYRSLLDGAGDGILRGGVGYRLGTMEPDGPRYGVDRDVFGACAGAALYRRDFFARVGMFDNDFFAYLEDVDLNMRARRIGCRCRFLASAIVYHIGSATSGSKINPLTIRLSTRNNINVLVKNYPLELFIRYLPVIGVYQMAWFAFVLKKGMFLPYLQGLWQAVRQFTEMAVKRRINDRKNIPVAEFDLLLRKAERDVIDSIMSRRSTAGKGNFLLQIYEKIFL